MTYMHEFVKRCTVRNGTDRIQRYNNQARDPDLKKIKMAAKVVQDFDEPVSSPMALEGKPPGMIEEANLAPFIEPLSKGKARPL